MMNYVYSVREACFSSPGYAIRLYIRKPQRSDRHMTHRVEKMGLKDASFYVRPVLEPTYERNKYAIGWLIPFLSPSLPSRPSNVSSGPSLASPREGGGLPGTRRKGTPLTDDSLKSRTCFGLYCFGS
jgi:hypothetical protein